MKSKIVFLMALFVLLSSVVAYAGNFQIQYPVGTDIMIMDTSGNLNVTSGTISENGVLLSDTYCALGGCTMTGSLTVTDASIGTLNVTTLLNASGATLDFDADSIAESDISFSTVCAAGNHLYISGNNLACESDSDTGWDIAGSDWIINVSDVLDWNETKGNATYILQIEEGNLNVNNSDTVDGVGMGTITSGKWCIADGTTEIDCNVEPIVDTTYTADEDYINLIGTVFTQNETTLNNTIETIGNETFVNVIGDTMTGDLNISSSNLIIDNTNITGSNTSSSHLKIDSSGNVILVLA